MASSSVSSRGRNAARCRMLRPLPPARCVLRCRLLASRIALAGLQVPVASEAQWSREHEPPHLDT